MWKIVQTIYEKLVWISSTPYKTVNSLNTTCFERPPWFKNHNILSTVAMYFNKLTQSTFKSCCQIKTALFVVPKFVFDKSAVNIILGNGWTMILLVRSIYFDLFGAFIGLVVDELLFLAGLIAKLYCLMCETLLTLTYNILSMIKPVLKGLTENCGSCLIFHI